ncbi:hypothetical protein EB796_014780 [Bugula neritina]|uniref:Uncharacterized protein n=1 Tax=Bugula neritina TaxID=10212 RepID=A0A7J7JLF1_BUGNE|nr:hypothetical protein EB796_014780 [Bugula neritina]
MLTWNYRRKCQLEEEGNGGQGQQHNVKVNWKKVVLSHDLSFSIMAANMAKRAMRRIGTNGLWSQFSTKLPLKKTAAYKCILKHIIGEYMPERNPFSARGVVKNSLTPVHIVNIGIAETNVAKLKM